MGAELRELGLPQRRVAAVAGAAALVLDRNDRRAPWLEQVELRDQAEALGGELDRGARRRILAFGRRARIGGRSARPVDSAMDERALGGVSVVLELAVDPLEVREARAVDVLVEDAGGEEVGRGHYATCCPHR